MEKKQTTAMYKVLKLFVRLFYGKMEVIGLEKLPAENAILVGNHTQMNGPIVGELFFPDNCYIWCAGEMMNKKEIPEYAFRDFWSQKPKWTHLYYKIAAHIITPIADCVFNNARTIAVYHDMRIMSTFKTSLKMLEKGANMLIFPEKDEKHNNILYKFQENFVDVAKLYHKKSGIELTFVPVYIAPKLRKVYIGEGIQYHSENKIEDERRRLCDYLSDEITKIARDLPPHTVVPYRNIPKKYYLSNKDITEVPR